MFPAGPGEAQVTIDCLELDWAARSPRLQPGPWVCRNVHPTTSLLHSPAPSSGSRGGGSSSSSSRGSSVAGRGVMAVSSRNVLQVTTSDSGGRVLAAAAHKQQLVQYALCGLPACMVELDPGLYALGDTMAAAYLLCFRGPSPWLQRVDTGGPLSSPSVLCCMQHSVGAGAEQQTILFLGSSGSNSQVRKGRAWRWGVSTVSCSPGQSCRGVISIIIVIIVMWCGFPAVPHLMSVGCYFAGV